jgi:hypothetical protein
MGGSVDGREFGAEAVDAAGHSERVYGAVSAGWDSGLFSAKSLVKRVCHLWTRTPLHQKAEPRRMRAFEISTHRSVAPFPERILSRNLPMRDNRVAAVFAELRLIT